MALDGRRVLYISYNGMLDPLGQSQVLPYLRELGKRGVRFSLLSFERQPAFKSSDGVERRKLLHRQLADENIDWHWLRYHRSPSVPATIYDVLNGIRYARKLFKQHKFELVHARAHIPAVIALAMKKQFGARMIFDLRGLMAEEYVEAQHWQEGNLAYRLTKTMERRVLKNADGVVTLTEKIWPMIQKWNGLRDRQVVHEVIPCCADLNLFSFNHEDRASRREELGLDDRFTLVYSGSIGSWYMSDKMADLFTRLLYTRNNAHFLWLTMGDPELIRRLMAERQLGPDCYTIKQVASRDVPSYLAAADAGIAFYKPGFSKLATSPVKVTEYLACGLPVIVNSGIGDLDTLITNRNLGSLVNEFAQPEYDRAIAVLDRSLQSPEVARQRARQTAEQLFDVRRVGGEGYARLYEKVLD